MSHPAQEKLIKAATKLFADQGFAATSTRDIVKEAGVNISLIAYHFGGKDGLLVACLEQAAENVFGRAAQTLKPPTNAKEFRDILTLFATTLLQAHAEHPQIFRLVQQEMERQSPAFMEVLRSRYLNYMQNLVQFFLAAQTQGVVRKELKPIALAIAFHGSIVHQVRLDPFRAYVGSGSFTDKKTREEILTSVLSVFCDGALS